MSAAWHTADTLRVANDLLRLLGEASLSAFWSASTPREALHAVYGQDAVRACDSADSGGPYEALTYLAIVRLGDGWYTCEVPEMTLDTDRVWNRSPSLRAGILTDSVYQRLAGPCVDEMALAEQIADRADLIEDYALLDWWFPGMLLRQLLTLMSPDQQSAVSVHLGLRNSRFSKLFQDQELLEQCRVHEADLLALYEQETLRVFGAAGELSLLPVPVEWALIRSGTAFMNSTLISPTGLWSGKVASQVALDLQDAVAQSRSHNW